MQGLRSLAAVSLAVLAAAADPIAQHTEEEAVRAQSRDEILALRAAHNRAIAARDMDGIMRLSADDYVLVAGSDAIVRGAAEMRERWAASFASPGFGCVRTLRGLEIGEQGGIWRAAETGTWVCTGAAPEAEMHGSYFAHWSRRSGAWRVVSDNYVTLGCRGRGC